LRTHCPQLDGLRAVAVAAVAWSHWERAYQGGIPFGAGVHLFFVLSGFLITGILLDIRALPDRAAAMRAFYIRRALRILPAFYLTLALAWVADVPWLRGSLPWHALYLSNVWIVKIGEWPGAISHLWSLAVEEQFYLVWPWLVVFAPRRWLTPAIAACVLAAPVFRWWMADLGYRESMLAVLTPGCLDSLGMGALLAVSGLASRTAFSAANESDAPNTLAPAALVACLVWVLLWRVDAASGASLALVAVKQTVQAFVFAWIVMRAAIGFRGRTGGVLSSAPIVYVGKISYGIYLAHGFVGDILATFGVASASLPEPLRFAVLSGVTVGVAAISWRLVESPINGLKRRVPYDVSRA